MYCGFTLSHTHCFYKYLIESGGFTKHNRFTRLTRHTAQRTCRRAGTDKRFRMNGELLHTGFITQNTAFAALAAGVDSQYRQFAVVFLQYVQSEYIDRRTLAGARYTADTYTDRVAGIWQALFYHLLGNGLMFGLYAFHQCHSPA